jgi:hypothetical protein
MSLDISIDGVTELLLADGWHSVVDRSFDLDAYEFSVSDRTIHGGGHSGVCATGFSAIVDEPSRCRLYGPLTAILAVRYDGEP